MRLSLVFAIALAACTPRHDRFADALAKMEEFTGRMCRCKSGDQACAVAVTDEMNRWAAESAKESRENRPPDEASIKKMEEIGTRYGACMAKAYGTGDPPPARPLPIPNDEAVTSADRIIKLTFDGAGTSPVGELELAYVRSDGTLDATYGRAEINFGRPDKPKPKPADDPARPLGAPVPVDDSIVYDIMAKCPTQVWTKGHRQDGEGACSSFNHLTRPKCSVLEIWKRAIEAGAPAEGLAVLSLRQDVLALGEAQAWQFSIDDAPRNLHFSHEVADTCDPTLEKPTPVPPGAGSAVKPNPY